MFNTFLLTTMIVSTSEDSHGACMWDSDPPKQEMRYAESASPVKRLDASSSILHEQTRLTLTIAAFSAPLGLAQSF